MSIVAHIIAIIASLAALTGAGWLIYIHFVAYADRIIDALLMEDRDGDRS